MEALYYAPVSFFFRDLVRHSSLVIGPSVSSLPRETTWQWRGTRGSSQVLPLTRGVSLSKLQLPGWGPRCPPSRADTGIE